MKKNKLIFNYKILKRNLKEKSHYKKDNKTNKNKNKKNHK